MGFLGAFGGLFGASSLLSTLPGSGIRHTEHKVLYGTYVSLLPVPTYLLYLVVPLF